MKYFIILFSVLLVGCSSTNKLTKLDNKTTINGGNELIKIQSQICNEFKSEDKILYSCGSGYSSDINLSRKKSLLDSKVRLQDKISSMVVKNEINKVEENSETGIKKTYSSNEQSSFSENYINGYQIVFDKTFLHNVKYYSFVVIKYNLVI